MNRFSFAHFQVLETLIVSNFLTKSVQTKATYLETKIYRRLFQFNLLVVEKLV